MIPWFVDGAGGFFSKQENVIGECSCFLLYESEIMMTKLSTKLIHMSEIGPNPANECCQQALIAIKKNEFGSGTPESRL